MAKHRTAKKQPSASAGQTARAKRREARRPFASVLLVAGAAAGMATVLTFGHATDNTGVLLADIGQVQLASAVIGVGGRGDSTSANIPAKINHTLVPVGCDCYIPVPYPAGYAIDNSVAAGVPVLDAKLQTAAATNPAVLVVGYSEGALVAEREKRALAATPGAATPNKVSFAMIASANLPNGGIFSRFPKLNLIFVKSNGPAEPTAYDTTYYTNEYDPYADFPAYFNVLALANSLAAVWYVHPDEFYDTVDLAAEPAGPAFTKTVVNSAGGTDTYIFVLADHLPLLAPLRQFSAALGLTAVTEPLVSAIEPFVRAQIDKAYTDRENVNPEAPTTFSFLKPLTISAPAAISVAPDNSISPAPKDTSQPKSQNTKPTFSPLAAKNPLFGKGTDKLKLFTTQHNTRGSGGSTSKSDDALSPSADAAPTGTPGKHDAPAASADSAATSQTSTPDTKKAS